jgi:hypothetical protein
MPITITFDIDTASLKDGNDRARIRLAFQRLGWETIGGTAYRYPPLTTVPGTPPPVEDWFNHVVPALMYMRSIIEQKQIGITNFTIDSVSSTGWRLGIGPRIQSSATIQLQPTSPNDTALTEDRLREWLQTTAAATA